MESTGKIRILLADEDALRRDGLAAVLHGNAQFEVVAQCPDGETALDQIRRSRPDVAVVDLNLPKLHGIELVRRVRGEMLGTKIVILAGTTDDDIIREVVRAGGDAYILKNGPARHLLDAISYVRDGGQYFSPQLRRDGLDRRLLEEQPRVPPESAPRREQNTQKDPPRREDPDDEPRARDREDDRSAPLRGSRDGRYGRSRRSQSRPGARANDGQRFRERLREEDAESENLDDRDYEILSMMADGIRPILDRLDEIEGRVVEMERGEAPVPGNVRNWLNREIADTFTDPGAQARDAALSRTVTDLEARLPHLIEEAVTARFHNMASKLQQEIEETHVRTLETFVRNIQVKLVQRVSALETDMSKQADAMRELQEYSMRTEENLGRLISGVDKLAQELPRRLAAAATAEPAPPAAELLDAPAPASKPSRFPAKFIWLAGVAVVVLGAAAFEVPRLLVHAKSEASSPSAAAPSSPASSSAAPAPAPAPAPTVAALPAGADTKTKMQAAQQYSDTKDYATAEDIYKQVLKTEPNNVDALKALASVLYREDKIEESAAILDKLPKTN